MSLKKTVAIVAAAGALAAISVPAMAFESEFHGMYKFKFIDSNVENGNTAADSRIVMTADKDHNKANSYLEQRARILYTAKASDDLKLVTGFELDARFGGTNNVKYGPTAATDSNGNKIAVVGSQDGGVLDADGVSLETKWVYLDFNVNPVNTNVKVGILPYKDSIKGIFLDADAAAAYTTTKLGPVTVGLGFLRAYDASGLQIATTGGAGTGTPAFVGDKTTDIYILDSKFNVTKDVGFGLSYYFVDDTMPIEAKFPTQIPLAAATPSKDAQTLLHTFALNADAKLGPVKLSGFAAKQFGTYRVAATPNAASNLTLQGYALNVAAAVAAGPVNIRTAVLYTSGEDNGDNKYVTSWQPVKTYNANNKQIGGSTTGGSGSSVTSYNEGGMMLLMRNTAQNNTNTDRYIVGTPDNQNRGITLATLGVDVNFTPKLYTNANIGFAWANKNNLTTTSNVNGTFKYGVNGSNYMGTEVNLETGYKLYDNLTASLQAAYVMLGGAYANTITNTDGTGKNVGTPANPYTGRVVLSYAF
jgi:hypothetical protein